MFALKAFLEGVLDEAKADIENANEFPVESRLTRMLTGREVFVLHDTFRLSARVDGGDSAGEGVWAWTRRGSHERLKRTVSGHVTPARASVSAGPGNWSFKDLPLSHKSLL